MRPIARLLLASLLLAPPASADEAITWNAVADQVLEKAYMGGPGWRTPATSRVHAQLGLAMFEAANAVDRRFPSWLGQPAAAPGTSAEAAVASAAHALLLASFPAEKGALDDALVVSLAAVPDGAGEDAGVALGKAIADAVRARHALPADAVLVPYRPLTTPGAYIDPRLPSILPFDLRMPPFFLARADALRPAGPPALDSTRYARDVEEVRRLGAKASSERAAHDTLLAKAWLDIDYSAIVGDIARRPGRTLVQNARLYALAWMVAEDAWLAIMDAKMHFNTWRPITAIRNADRDGNPGTAHDPAWEPLLPTPSHPDYPCGHCGVAAAVATVLAAETGEAPDGGIRLQSYEGNAGFRARVATWTAFVDAMSLSRIHAGAHTRFANDDAEAMGRAAAALALERLPPAK